MHKTRETQKYVVHPVWTMYTEKNPVLLFILSSKLKRYNLQQIRCNSLFSLNLLSLPHSEYRYTYMQYNSLIYSEGLPSRAKNPKLNINSIVISLPNHRPRLITKLQHFTRKFYIYS